MNKTIFLEKISAINKKYENIANITGENFNLFRILKIESSEVRAHSAFLAELLNPKGTHGQKDLFLKIFIQLLGIEGFDNLDVFEADVKIEESVGDYGRIDIVIKPRQGKKIVIENKIYAIDQDKQLIRYKEAYPDCHLLYLTLDGKEPSVSSITDNDRSIFLKVGSDYFSISYKENILSWLTLCRKEATNHPILRETISQYINLIKHLTKQSMSEANKTEIIEAIISSPECIEAAQNIANTWEGAKFAIINNLKNRLGEVAQKHELKIEYSDIILGKKESSFWFFKKEWEYCVYFEFISNLEDMHFGIDFLNSSQERDDSLKAVLNERLLNKGIGENLNLNYWMWVSRFNAWDDASWKDVMSVIPFEIDKILKKITTELNDLIFN